MKKLISAVAAVLACCLLSVSAFAADLVDISHVYISDATIEVGDTYTWSYDSEAGYVDYGEQGTALKIVSGQNNDEGGMTFVYEAVAPGTHTFTIFDRWYINTYKTVTVTVVEAGGDQTDVETSSENQPSENQPSETQPSGEQPANSQAPAAASSAAGDHTDIARAIADGTWGSEYTTCPGCGYHNWTAKDGAYVCDHCGHVIRQVKTSAGVKGYTAPAATAPAATQADVDAAQAANDAYLEAIRVLQRQIADREAAYLAALGQ